MPSTFERLLALLRCKGVGQHNLIDKTNNEVQCLNCNFKVVALAGSDRLFDGEHWFDIAVCEGPVKERRRK